MLNIAEVLTLQTLWMSDETAGLNTLNPAGSTIEIRLKSAVVISNH